jgi:hypothetical protein
MAENLDIVNTPLRILDVLFGTFSENRVDINKIDIDSSRLENHCKNTNNPSEFDASTYLGEWLKTDHHLPKVRLDLPNFCQAEIDLH